MPVGQKVCYRPVFDVETLLTPPPDPFNLEPPAQHKVHKSGELCACNCFLQRMLVSTISRETSSLYEDLS